MVYLGAPRPTEDDATGVTEDESSPMGDGEATDSDKALSPVTGEVDSDEE